MPCQAFQVEITFLDDLTLTVVVQAANAVAAEAAARVAVKRVMRSLMSQASWTADPSMRCRILSPSAVA